MIDSTELDSPKDSRSEETPIGSSLDLFKSLRPKNLELWTRNYPLPFPGLRGL